MADSEPQPEPQPQLESFIVDFTGEPENDLEAQVDHEGQLLVDDPIDINLFATELARLELEANQPTNSDPVDSAAQTIGISDKTVFLLQKHTSEIEIVTENLKKSAAAAGVDSYTYAVDGDVAKFMVGDQTIMSATWHVIGEFVISEELSADQPTETQEDQEEKEQTTRFVFHWGWDEPGTDEVSQFTRVKKMKGAFDEATLNTPTFTFYDPMILNIIAAYAMEYMELKYVCHLYNPNTKTYAVFGFV